MKYWLAGLICLAVIGVGITQWTPPDDKPLETGIIDPKRLMFSGCSNRLDRIDERITDLQNELRNHENNIKRHRRN